MNAPSSPEIVGLTGTHAAGKGTIVTYLVGLGFARFSARDDVLWPEVDRRGLARDRTSLGIVANDLRARFGAAHIVFTLYELARASGKNAVIESIYHPREIARVQGAAGDHRFILAAIDADIRIRYKRSKGRDSETDQVGFKQFVLEEERELRSPDPDGHQLAAAMAMAELRFRNDGTVEELHAKLDKHFGWRFKPQAQAHHERPHGEAMD